MDVRFLIERGCGIEPTWLQVAAIASIGGDDLGRIAVARFTPGHLTAGACLPP